MHILMTGNTSFKLVNFRSGLIESLVSEGHHVSAMVPPDKGAVLLKDMGCSVLPLTLSRKGLRPHQEFFLLKSFWRTLKNVKPDVVFGFTIKNNIYGGLAANQVGIPIIPNITGLGYAFEREGALNVTVSRMYRLAFRKAPKVFFQNKENQDLFISKRIIREGQGRILPGSGVNTTEFAAAPLPGGDDNPTFLMISRLLHAKGIREYVEAASVVRRMFPQAKFQLLGPFDPGNPGAIDAKTLEGWVGAGDIEYLGEADDVRPFIRAADCIVHPTYYLEGTPRVLLEGASMARPVITTDTPGCRDVVVGKLTGYLCRPQDTGSLTDSIMRFAKMDRRARAEMGLRGRERIVNLFDENLVIEAYREEIARLM